MRAQPRLWKLMASKTEVTPQKEEVPENEGLETPPDSPPLDLPDAAIKKLIRTAKKRGYVTRDQMRCASHNARTSPVGPAPTTDTSVSDFVGASISKKIQFTA